MKYDYLRQVLAVLLVLFLPGCNSFHEKPLPPSEATKVILNIVWVESESDFPVEIMPAYYEQQRGAAVYFDIDGVRHCTVYAFKPYSVGDFKHLNTLGHEILHCTDGAYHNPAFSSFAEEGARSRFTN